MNKILITTDGADSTKKAIEKGAELAANLDAEPTLIHIYTEFKKVSFEISDKLSDQQDDLMKKRGQKIIDEDAKYFEEKGIDVKKVLKMGDPASEICDYAEKNDFDLIIVSDKGEGKVERFLLGSTSDKIVRYANQSVMVVR